MRYIVIIIMNLLKSVRNGIRSVFYSGKNNDYSVEKSWVIRVIYLITTNRKLIVIMFRIVGFKSFGKL